MKKINYHSMGKRKQWSFGGKGKKSFGGKRKTMVIRWKTQIWEKFQLQQIA